MPHIRIDITLHSDDLKKLDRICRKRDQLRNGKPKRSTMIARLIQEYNEQGMR